jgi:hypothetical protein
MGGIRWWVAAGILLLPMALAEAPQVLELRAQIASFEVDHATALEARDGLFRLDLGLEPQPSLLLDDATKVSVTQYWVNTSVLVDPVSGATLERLNEVPESKTWTVEPGRITFLHPTDLPDVRVDLNSLFGLTLEPVSHLRVDTSVAPGALGPSRGYQATRQGHLVDFDRAPPNSGWVELGADQVSGPGEIRLLIDGWGVRLEDAREAQEIHTGSGHDDGHHFGNGGHTTETYSFLYVRAEGARLGLPPAARLEGYAPAPQIAWDGPARLELFHGDIDAGPDRVPVTQKDMTLDGRFQADVEFGPDAAFAGAPLRAAGVGVTSVPLPKVAGGLAPAQQLGVWASVAVGALTVGVVGVQTYRSPKRGPTPPAAAASASAPAPPEKLGLGELLERAQKTPLDGELQFRLGVELFRQGRPDVGLRALDRSFRLHPPAIVQLLEDPELASIRDRADIRQLLGRLQREQHRKLWAGYA